eukprot:CAMPEP_0170464488 /NCGR_PEP_ID=MMETSP0123-20130129/9197_1 /TAXON_ID=182087 /ORGANISM="Favella ehrenbergii, Strain Fehren 1" /LENGTH=166 /DNA_ID=CAMNT_0010730165 /DNA_START=894 /DNA_END=1393 /DNA_ORIENTATION=-
MSKRGVEVGGKGVQDAIRARFARLRVIQKREEEQYVEKAVVQTSQIREAPNQLNRVHSNPEESSTDVFFLFIRCCEHMVEDDKLDSDGQSFEDSTHHENSVNAVLSHRPIDGIKNAEVHLRLADLERSSEELSRILISVKDLSELALVDQGRIEMWVELQMLLAES